MNLLRRSFSTFRTWLGLGDPADERLTPSHGWLLPSTGTSSELNDEGATAPTEPPLA